MNDVVLSLSKATKLYAGVPAIDGVDFKALAGEWVAQQANLRGIRGDDGDVARRNTRIEK